MSRGHGSEAPAFAGSMTITEGLARRVHHETGQNVYLCYQCGKCSAGCPVSRFVDWQPHQVMRAVQLGQEDPALVSATPWLCAGCQTCSTRCPQGLDVAAVMEFLTREALNRKLRPRVREVRVFDQAFLRQVRLWGRNYEPGMMAEIKLRTGDIAGDMGLAVRMFLKGKLPVLPHRAASHRPIQPTAGPASPVAYFPGCSLRSTASELDTSARGVCQALGITLIEPDGWVCCGSSAAHRADPPTALRLPLENLSGIEKLGLSEVTMPCAACFSRHKSAQCEIQDHVHEKAAEAVHVSTLIETIHAHAGLAGVTDRAKRTLKGLRVACYYGCLLTRPPRVTGAEHPENPRDMDELMSALGMEVVDWSYKTACCGATHSLTRREIAQELSRTLIEHARQAGAEMIAVACPLCHTNLDARQLQMNLGQPMPVLYFTQLMALAFGLSEGATGLQRNLVDPSPLLRSKGLLG